METVSICVHCGRPLSHGRLDGLCPSCVAAGLLSDTPGHDAPLGTNDTRLRYVGDYELQEEIARGGMGVVYRARQISLNRIVAVKMILAGELASAEAVRRFRKEAEAAAALQHPNIVAIHEIGEHNGLPYFSMDYVEGQNLSQLMNQGGGQPMPPTKAAAYLATLARAIQYAHEQGTLHRDLKPSNVLIDAFDQPRITDFGLAKRLDGEAEGLEFDPQLTRSGQVVGTPAFMPPEQAAAKSGAIGPPSDVYALGAILYFLLTGKPPFVGASLAEIVQHVLHDDPVPPRALNPTLPRDLETITLKCLEKESRRRYATAQQLAEDLMRFLNGEPVLARSVGRVERIWRTCQKHRVIATLVVGLILLPIATAIMVGNYSDRKRRSAGLETPPIAEMPVRSGQGVAGVIDGKIYVTSVLIGEGSFRKFLHVYDPESNSWKQLADSAVPHPNAAAGVIGGKLCVAGGLGGENPGNILEIFDPRSGTWSTKAPMLTPRGDCAGAVINDRLYVTGGTDGTNFLSTVESYDPVTDRWQTEPPMPTARGGCGAAVIDGVLYVVGGSTDASNYSAVVESYKPGGKWSTRDPLREAVSSAFVSTLNGVLHVAGGIGPDGETDAHQIYIPRWTATNGLWGIREPLPESRYHGCGAVALKDELYVFGGWQSKFLSEGLPYRDVFVYDPRRNSWRKSAGAGGNAP